MAVSSDLFMAWRPLPKHHEMRHREIDNKAGADRQQLCQHDREECFRDKQRCGVCEQAEQTGCGESDIRTPGQFAPGFGGEGRHRVHDIRTRHRDTPGNQVGGYHFCIFTADAAATFGRPLQTLRQGGDGTYQMQSQPEDSVVDGGIDHADERKTGGFD